MKLDGGPLLTGAMLAVAGCEIIFHWLLGRGGFPSILAIYLAADAGGKHFFGGVVDNIAPAAILGWINGLSSYPRWSLRRGYPIAFALSVFVVALTPLYRSLIGPERFTIVWGSPNNTLEVGFSYIFRVASAFLVAGFFTRAGYIFRRDWKPRTFYLL